MDIKNGICPKCGGDLNLALSYRGGSSVASFQCDYCFSKMQDFEIFVNCLSIAYREFCLNKKMRKEIEGGLYYKFEKQWNTILVALEMDYKLWLAKILDKDDAPDCLKGFVAKRNPEIIKIENWRNNFHAHFNENTLRNWKKFREENDLKEDSIKILFDKIVEIAEQYCGGDHLLGIKESFQRIEQEVLEECNKWLDNFKNN